QTRHRRARARAAVLTDAARRAGAAVAGAARARLARAALVAAHAAVVLVGLQIEAAGGGAAGRGRGARRAAGALARAADALLADVADHVAAAAVERLDERIDAVRAAAQLVGAAARAAAALVGDGDLDAGAVSERGGERAGLADGEIGRVGAGDQHQRRRRLVGGRQEREGPRRREHVAERGVVRDQHLALARAVDVAHLVADAGGHRAVRLIGEELARIFRVDADHRLDAHHVLGRDVAQFVVERDLRAAGAATA